MFFRFILVFLYDHYYRKNACQMIELCCEYLSVWCIWLHVIIMSCTRFRVSLHFVVSWMSRNSLLAPISLKEFLDIHTTVYCRFTLKRVRDMIITYSQLKVKFGDDAWRNTTQNLTKWFTLYLVNHKNRQSIQNQIQNPVKHLRWSFLRKYLSA